MHALEASIERAHAREDEDEDEVEDQHEETTAVEHAHAEDATVGVQRAHMQCMTDECCDAATFDAASERNTEGKVDQLWHLVRQHGWDVRFCDTLGDILPRRSDFLWDVFVDAWSRGVAEDDAFNAALQISLDVVHQREQEQEQGNATPRKKWSRQNVIRDQIIGLRCPQFVQSAEAKGHSKKTLITAELRTASYVGMRITISKNLKMICARVNTISTTGIRTSIAAMRMQRPLRAIMLSQAMPNNTFVVWASVLPQLQQLLPRTGMTSC